MKDESITTMKTTTGDLVVEQQQQRPIQGRQRMATTDRLNEWAIMTTGHR